jgi:cell division transport system permease protein
MKANALAYCFRSAFKNMFHKKLFSLASMATISACIFLFCLFFSIIVNVQNMAHQAETTIGVTVLFQEDAPQQEIDNFGEILKKRPEVKSFHYISKEEAWESFKHDYFHDNELLAQAFQDDNPLAGSQNYEIFLKNIENQNAFVDWLYSNAIVRQVNFSNVAVSAFATIEGVISALSAVIIGVLLAVSVFLISNTISVAAQFRRKENEIMKMLGATNTMIRLPFMIEGVFLGFVGALLPLAGIYVLYERATRYTMQYMVDISSLFTPVPLRIVFPWMILVAMGLGVGIGFIVSFFTIRKALRV